MVPSGSMLICTSTLKPLRADCGRVTAGSLTSAHDQVIETRCRPSSPCSSASACCRWVSSGNNSARALRLSCLPLPSRSRLGSLLLGVVRAFLLGGLRSSLFLGASAAAFCLASSADFCLAASAAAFFAALSAAFCLAASSAFFLAMSACFFCSAAAWLPQPPWRPRTVSRPQPWLRRPWPPLPLLRLSSVVGFHLFRGLLLGFLLLLSRLGRPPLHAGLPVADDAAPVVPARTALAAVFFASPGQFLLGLTCAELLDLSWTRVAWTTGLRLVQVRVKAKLTNSRQDQHMQGEPR